MFTQEQINEIYKRLVYKGIKDSTFTQADNINGTETLTILQDGTNKRVTLESFIQLQDGKIY